MTGLADWRNESENVSNSSGKEGVQGRRARDTMYGTFVFHADFRWFCWFQSPDSTFSRVASGLPKWPIWRNKATVFYKKKCASFHNFCDLSKKIAESSNFNFILWQRHSTLGSVVLLEMFINTLRSEFIENKTIRDGGITVLDYQSPSDHERQCQLENTYLQ